MRNQARILLWSTVVMGGLLWLLNIIAAACQIMGKPLPIALPAIVTVDISTVTTLVIFTQLIYITRGIVQYRSAGLVDEKPHPYWHPSFPYPASIKAQLVQWGLLGTIWAFIIAFSNLGTTAASDVGDTLLDVASASNYDPTVLIAPLGTALWSTFSGIMAAFVVVPFVQERFRNRIGPPSRQRDAGDALDTLGFSFRELTNGVQGACDGLSRLHAQITAIAADLEVIDVRSVVASVQANTQQLAALNGTTKSLVDVQASTKEQLSDVRTGLRAVDKSLAALAERSDRLEAASREQATQTAALIAESAKHIAELDRSREATDSLTIALGRVLDRIEPISLRSDALADALRELQEELRYARDPALGQVGHSSQNPTLTSGHTENGKNGTYRRAAWHARFTHWFDRVTEVPLWRK